MSRRATILAACLALLAPASQAMSLLYVEGVQGNSTTAGYAGWFVALSSSWSLERQAGTIAHSFTVTVEEAAGLSALAQMAAGSKSAPRIIVDHLDHVQQGGLKVYLRVTCEDASIRSFASSAGGSVTGASELKIQCAKLQWEHLEYNNSGVTTKTGKGSWNFKTNAP